MGNFDISKHVGSGRKMWGAGRNPLKKSGKSPNRSVK